MSKNTLINTTICIILMLTGSSISLRRELEHDFSSLHSTSLAQTKLFSDALVGFVGGLMNRGPPQRKDYYRMRHLETHHGVRKQRKGEKKGKDGEEGKKNAITRTINIITPKNIPRHNLMSHRFMHMLRWKNHSKKEQLKSIEKKLVKNEKELNLTDDIKNHPKKKGSKTKKQERKMLNELKKANDKST